jgi:hypothetical protein
MTHLRVFRSVIYAHVPDQRRTKLDNKSEKLMYIGYNERLKAYKLFNPIEKKVISSRDIYINEQSGWHWKKQEELKVEVVEEQPKIMIPTPNIVISGLTRDEQTVERTWNDEASTLSSSGTEKESEDEEDEPRQP